MLTFNNKAIKIGSTNAWISNTYIPKKTLRFRFLAWDDDVPTDHLPTLAELQSWQKSTPLGTWTQIGTNVFDWTCSGRRWGANSGTNTCLYRDTAGFRNSFGDYDSFLRHIKFDIIGADLSGVNDISYLFSYMHIVHCGTLKNADSVTSTKCLFQSPDINVATLESVGHLNLPRVANTSDMFVYQSKLVSIDGITTSAALSNMSEMFSSCTSLVSVPLFNTSGVTNASRAFWNCHALTSIPAFDFSSGTVPYVGNLFRNCEKVQSGSLAIYNQFNTSGLTPDYTAFFNCGIDTASGVAELEQIPGAWGGKLISTDPIAADTLRCKYSILPLVGSWAMNAVDAYNGIFDLTLHTTWHNTAINGQPISVIGQGDCSTITGVRGVFYKKTSLTSVCDLSFPAATNAQDLFEYCSALETVGNISLPSCTNVSGMFYGCSSLTSVPLFDTSRVTNFGIDRGMLAGCTALKTVPLYNTSSATVTSNMCNGCTAVESGALALYQQASTQATPPTTHTDMFKNCGANTTSGAAELSQIPTDWGGTMSA